MKLFVFLLLFLNSFISILTANEYKQNLNFQLTGKNHQESVLPRKIITKTKLVISEKPYEKPVVANRFEYLPYGETWVTEGDGNNNPKYNSQELDKETNFYFYNARSFRLNCQSRAIPETNEVAHYDPEIARFVTADTVIDGEGSVKGWNRYMYVAGNPISYRDPTGHDAYIIVGGTTTKDPKGHDKSAVNYTKATKDRVKDLRKKGYKKDIHILMYTPSYEKRAKSDGISKKWHAKDMAAFAKKNGVKLVKAKKGKEIINYLSKQEDGQVDLLEYLGHSNQSGMMVDYGLRVESEGGEDTLNIKKFKKLSSKKFADTAEINSYGCNQAFSYKSGKKGMGFMGQLNKLFGVKTTGADNTTLYTSQNDGKWKPYVAKPGRWVTHKETRSSDPGMRGTGNQEDGEIRLPSSLLLREDTHIPVTYGYTDQ